MESTIMQKKGKNFSLLCVIANIGDSEKALKEAREAGVTGGTIFLGKGTAKNHILELLGIDEIKKEIILMMVDADNEDNVLQRLTTKLRLDKPNHGIAFSLPVKCFLGSRSSSASKYVSDSSDLEGFELIFTIVPRGSGGKVINTTTASGAYGNTLIHARGCGKHEKDTLFSIALEPEKEIILTLTEKKATESIVNSVVSAIDLYEPGNGILFVLKLNHLSY